MRILTITNMYPPHHYGGYELECAGVMGEFRRRGHDVHVLTSDHRVPGVQEAEIGDISVDRRLRMYWDDHEILDPGPLGRWRIERHNRRVLLDALEAHRPDVVSVWAMGCLSLSMIGTAAHRGVPVVAKVCDDWLIYGPRVDGWNRALRHRPRLDGLIAKVLRQPPARNVVEEVSVFCFVSETTAAAAQEHSPFRIGPATVTYSGIDEQQFPVGEYRPGAESTHGFGWQVLYVGRLDPRKGTDTAIRTMAHLPPSAQLTIVGRGDDEYRRELEELTRSLGLDGRIRFGVKDRHELSASYADADVVLFPSRWSEPFGLVPLEAMACGTPVVATGVGGSGEFLVDDVNCLLAPPDDHKAMADAIRRIARDSNLRERLRVGGTALARELTIGRLADVLEEWHIGAASASLPPLENRTIASLVQARGSDTAVTD